MTDEMMDLRRLVEKAPTPTSYAMMEIAFAAEAADGDGGRGEDRRSAWRAVARTGWLSAMTGYRDRGWETRDGTVEAAHPETARKGLILSRASLSRAGWPTRALTAVIQEALYPRRLDPLGRRSGPGDGRNGGLEERQVSRLCEGDRRTGQGLPRSPARRRLALPLARCDLPQKCAAITVSFRWPSSSRSASSLRMGGAEVLGMDIGSSEAETFWVEFLRKLQKAGSERRPS